MTVLERKERLVKAIMNDMNEKRVSKIERLYEPCIYTIEEIREFLPKRIKDIEDGKGILHEDIMRKYEL